MVDSIAAVRYIRPAFFCGTFMSMAGHGSDLRMDSDPERRRAPREGGDPLDWESRAILRVAQRVASFDEKEAGWEEVALRRLRRHLAGDPGKSAG